MKTSTKTLIAAILSLVVVILFCIAGIGELAAFFVILAVLLLAVTVGELDRERTQAKQAAEYSTQLEYE